MTPTDSMRDRLLLGIWRLVAAVPGTVVLVSLAVALGAALAAHLFLGLNADQDHLVSPDLPFQQRYLQHLENFGDQEYLFIVVHNTATEEGRTQVIQFADRLADRLAQHPDLIDFVHYRVSAGDLGRGALLFATPADAQALAGTVEGLAPAIRQWWQDGSLAGLFQQLAGAIGAEGAPAAADPALLGGAMEWLEGVLETAAGQLAGVPTPAPELDLGRMGTDYFFTAGDRFLIMRVMPDKDYSALDVIGRPLQVVRSAMAETLAEFPGVRAGLTGRPVLQADEMQTTNRDMTLAATLAVLLVGLLFTIVLHGWLRPALVVAALLTAMAWTFGFATLAVGELNLLSIVFALVLVGIGVDFGVHMVTRSMEAEIAGATTDEAVHTALRESGPGIMLTAITSVCAFFSVLFSDFVGLAELGLIGGIGILLCLVAMLVLLPAMLLMAGRRGYFPKSRPRLVTLPALERCSSRPGLLLIALALASIAVTPGLFGVGFNYNLLELQARGLESVEYERLLLDETEESTWYAIMVADTLAEVDRLEHALSALPEVGRIESILNFLPEDQPKKAAIYAPAARELEDLAPLPADPGPSPAGPLEAALVRLDVALAELEERLFAAGAAGELVRLERIRQQLEGILDSLAEQPEAASRLIPLQAQLARDAGRALEQLRIWLETQRVRPEELAPAIRDLFIGRDGTFQVKVAPAIDIWDFDRLGDFVAELRRVDPEVSGTPVVVFESARLMRRTFLQAAAVTLLLVGLILWVNARSMRSVVLTLLPLGIGILWLLMGMGWLGWTFNLANFFAIPILIAIGVDGGVHFLARWQTTAGRHGLFHTSTPTAVALSFSTTMIGFGGLLLAHHRGLASLGQVMVLGSLTTMLACLLVLPAVFKWMIKNDDRRKQ